VLELKTLSSKKKKNTLENITNRLDQAKEKILGIEEKLRKYYIQTVIDKNIKQT
jgi:hypothetical protein